MAHHVKEWDVPDCPKCGKEMQIISKCREDSIYPDNPWGIREYFWKCDCGYIVKTEKDGEI